MDATEPAPLHVSLMQEDGETGLWPPFGDITNKEGLSQIHEKWQMLEGNIKDVKGIKDLRPSWISVEYLYTGIGGTVSTIYSNFMI